MSGKPRLELVAQPQAYFHELVTTALEKERVCPLPETEFYLVSLLEQFMCTDRLREEPLALMLKQALEQPVPELQRQRFREVGDLSLYVAGFFQDSLNRKLVDVDYYIDMGGSAYQQVAARADSPSGRELYAELADKFGSFVDVLAAVSDQTSGRTEKDLLRLYEVWIRTRSERAARQLQEAGILPNRTLKKDHQ
jgi:hypothetical protein